MFLSNARRSGFTTIELLVVIGIIVMLVGLLIPVVGKIRDSARQTDTAAWVANLGGAIEAYHSDFRAYPGPLKNDEIRAPNYGDAAWVGPPPAPQNFVFATVNGYANQTGPATDGRYRITM